MVTAAAAASAVRTSSHGWTADRTRQICSSPPLGFSTVLLYKGFLGSWATNIWSPDNEAPRSIPHICNLLTSIRSRDVRGEAFFCGAGRGKGKNPRGGAVRGGAKKRLNRLIQKFDKSA